MIEKNIEMIGEGHEFNRFDNEIYENKKKGSNRMAEPNLLILSYELYNKEGIFKQ